MNLKCAIGRVRNLVYKANIRRFSADVEHSCYFIISGSVASINAPKEFSVTSQYSTSLNHISTDFTFFTFIITFTPIALCIFRNISFAIIICVLGYCVWVQCLSLFCPLLNVSNCPSGQDTFTKSADHHQVGTECSIFGRPLS